MTVLQTANLPENEPVDVVSKWLVITRAAVFTMTLTSGAIGGLLAASTGGANWAAFSGALVGLLLAHAASNMINDYFDLEEGLDGGTYPRSLYAPHPILSGFISKRGLKRTIVAVTLAGVAICTALTVLRGWPVVALALAGFLTAFFYVAPPIRFKRIGLGEPAVFLIWGPMMIGGTYYVTAGSLPGWVLAASLPYAILVTTVLIGKHIDKIAQDGDRGIRTLPVILGERLSLRLNMALMVSFYLIVIVLVAVGWLCVWVLLIGLAVPRLVRVFKIYADPKPARPPEGYRLWPLWYVAGAFYLNKLAGAMFVLGLLLGLVFPIRIG